MGIKKEGKKEEREKRENFSYFNNHIQHTIDF